MDGYGLDTAALTGPGPWLLPVAGVARAGDRPRACPAGVAVRILTGAQIPPGVGAVITQAAVLLQGAQIVLHSRPAPAPISARPPRHRPARGLHAGRGRPGAGRGAPAGPGAILHSGSELVAPGTPLAPGQIWNTIRALLAAALSRPAFDLLDLGPVPDRPDQLAAALRQAAGAADLVVTTGGVLGGDADHVTALVRESAGGSRR